MLGYNPNNNISSVCAYLVTVLVPETFSFRAQVTKHYEG